MSNSFAYRIALFLLCAPMFSWAQYDFEAVLPGLDGQDLFEAVAQDFDPLIVLPYDIARDTMFRRVYSESDFLYCVYTRHGVSMPQGLDPTQTVFMGGANGGINTEHSWPRSYGADVGKPKSDMHHLFPTRIDVNADRGVLPFLDIPDSEANQWYYLNNEQSNIPSSNIDNYSEVSGSAFEPREDHKGNVARAMFYFYTIYNDEAQQAPSNFFESMRTTLCEWHSADPVDSLEWHRNLIIASYQDGKANPFILDCTLVERLFCPGAMINCDPSVPVAEISPTPEVSIYPNPNSGTFNIELGVETSMPDHVQFSDLAGRSIPLNWNNYGNRNLNIELNNIKAGFYLLSLRIGGNNYQYPIIINSAY